MSEPASTGGEWPVGGGMRLYGAGLVVGLVAGALLARSVYRTGVTAPAAVRAAASPGAAAPASMDAAEQRMHDAIDLLLQRARSDPSDFEARVLLGNATFDSGLYDMAAPLYEQALAIDGTDAGVRIDLALALSGLGRGPEALEQLGRAVEADPGHAGAWYDLAVLRLVEGNDPDGAREALARALAIDPGLPAEKLQARLAGGAGEGSV